MTKKKYIYIKRWKQGKCKDAHFVSVGPNSIVSNFDCEVSGQVAVPEGQITVKEGY